MDKFAGEWMTALMIGAVYGLWVLLVFAAPGIPLWITIPLLGIVIAFHASLSHEVIHGHPFPKQLLNDLIMMPALSLIVPYLRFKHTHLDHHRDEHLTDPYDDPESNFLDPGRWVGLCGAAHLVLRANNTLAGRIVIGPLVGTLLWLRSDWRAMRSGDVRVTRGWLFHLPFAVGLISLIIWAPMPLWAYLYAAYLGLSLIRIRTFLEHRAHELPRARTAIVERGGFLGFLFLNNNLHVVHHMHPGLAWYDLPARYRAKRHHYRARNDGYIYRSYGEIFRSYFLKAKDPVPHPLWPRD